MTEPVATLVQFPHSTFCEKVRWALDLKDVPHVRRNVLPGPHMFQVRRLTGRTQTPVLRFHENAADRSDRVADADEPGRPRIIDESTDIIRELESRWPSPAVMPEAPAQRDAVLQLVSELDAELGPDVRRLMFALLRNEHRYAAESFALGRSWAARTAYRLMVPMVMRHVTRVYRVSPDRVETSRSRIRAWLDRIAEQTSATGYLIGEGFTLADLTAASLLSPLLRDPENAGARPSRRAPAALREARDAHAAEPAVRWAHGIYERHRPPDGTACVDA